MNTLRKLYSENETNVWATLERIKDYNGKREITTGMSFSTNYRHLITTSSKLESEFIQSKFDAKE